ncbi:MAG: response regulator [Betaproteobacteria bacterium]|jgi:two-component system phosphate regulon response regulator OmpR
MSPYSIVIVEDNLAVQEALCDHLREQGFEVRGVDSGAALDAALAQSSAHALVLDLNLPGEDGHSIAQRMRARFPRIGILMLSAALAGAGGRARQPQVDVYLRKPAQAQALTDALRALCEAADAR